MDWRVTPQSCLSRGPSKSVIDQRHLHVSEVYALFGDGADRQQRLVSIRTSMIFMVLDIITVQFLSPFDHLRHEGDCHTHIYVESTS